MTENRVTDSPLPHARSQPAAANRMQLAVSRICHDLVSPLGAIANGIELLLLSGQGASAELDLIDASSAAALARLRFFRMAYGIVEPDKELTAKEVRAVLAALSLSGRVKSEWAVAGQTPAREVQAVFLSIQCLECALPYGGEVRVTHESSVWRLDVHAARIKPDPVYWAPLARGAAPPDLSPSTLQFTLLAELWQSLGRRPTIQMGEQAITVTF